MVKCLSPSDLIPAKRQQEIEPSDSPFLSSAAAQSSHALIRSDRSHRACPADSLVSLPENKCNSKISG